MDKDTPFAYEPPTLPRCPFESAEDFEPNRQVLAAARRAYTAAEQAVEHATEAAPRIQGNEALSEVGKRRALAEAIEADARTLMEAITSLASGSAALEAQEAALMAEPKPTPDTAIERQERLALAQAFKNLPHAENKAALEKAVGGQDLELVEVLARTNTMITGIGEPTQRVLLERLLDADPEKRERAEALALGARRLGTVQAAVVTALDSLERAADRATLKEKGLGRLYLSDMTDQEKVAFVGKHGLEAFQALPR